MRNLPLKSLALTGVVGLMLAGGSLAVSTVPAEAGARTGTWRYYNPGYAYRPYYRHRNYGGAVAAGVVGGLALGALGAAAASPYYGSGYYGSGYYAPVYGTYDPGYAECYWVRRRGWDAWGNPVIRRVQVCE